MAESIPIGYQLHVTSWENDADAYKTIITSGLTLQDTKFLIWLARHFTSKNSADRGLGNSEVPRQELVELILEGALQFELSPDLRQRFSEVDSEDEDPYELIAQFLLGNPETYDKPNFCRVFSSFEVYYYPSEVQEISDSFK